MLAEDAAAAQEPAAGKDEASDFIGSLNPILTPF